MSILLFRGHVRRLQNSFLRKIILPCIYLEIVTICIRDLLGRCNVELRGHKNSFFWSTYIPTKIAFFVDPLKIVYQGNKNRPIISSCFRVDLLCQLLNRLAAYSKIELCVCPQVFQCL